MDITDEDFNENVEFLKDYNNWYNIPLLNYSSLHKSKNSSIVRFRGMIQDMLNPEIYLEKYEVLNSDKTIESSHRIQSGKYRDNLVLKENEFVNYDSTLNVYGERRLIYITSIPRFNKWASDVENNEITKTSAVNNSINSNGQNDTNKRIRIDTATNSSVIFNSVACSSSQNISIEYSNAACMVIVYSNFDDFALNSVIETVGFLSINSSSDNSMDDYDSNEFKNQNDFVPRLHAIAFRKLEHLNPLLDISITRNVTENLNLQVHQHNLKILLTQCLFGDEIAADYLICHLISKVYTRSVSEPLGQFTLNISNIPSTVLPEYTERLYEILESLLPASHYFPMTLENMNSTQFIPKKDYKTNRLISGLLQLAPHTHLILDETKLKIGKLEHNGILGVQYLSYLIKSQQIKCDFEFYEIDYNTNIPILVLSEGKSMLPSNFHIPLHISDSESIQSIFETLKAAKNYLQSKLFDLRKYLTISKMQDFNISSDDSKMIENDFVEMRRSNKEIGPNELHSLLVLSRLIGLAKGRNIFDQNAWNLAKHMEEIRRNRLKDISRIRF